MQYLRGKLENLRKCGPDTAPSTGDLKQEKEEERWLLRGKWVQLMCGKRGKAKQESGRTTSIFEPARPDGRPLCPHWSSADADLLDGYVNGTHYG